MKKFFTKFAAVIITLFIYIAGFSQTYYFSVAGGPSSPQDGSSWDNSLPATQLVNTIHAKGYNGGTPITVYLKAGTYNVALPNTATFAAGLNIADENLTLQGGFPTNATGTDISKYNPNANITVIDAASDNNTIFSANNNLTTPSSFTFKGLDIINFPGGFLNFNMDGQAAQPISLRIEDVSAHNNTGDVLTMRGFSGSNKSILVKDTYFTNNTSGHPFDFYSVGGGGSYVVDHSTFVSNTSAFGQDGAGIYIYGTTGMEVKNSFFCSNSIRAIQTFNSSSLNVHDNVFRKNTTTAGAAGGAMTIYINGGTDVSIANNQFYGSPATTTNPYVVNFNGVISNFSGNTFDVAQTSAYGAGLTATGANTFSATDPGTDCPTRDVALPIQWGTVSASIDNGSLTVKWTTVSEANNDHFNIEASTDGKNFKKIGDQKTLNKDGNASAPTDYTFTVGVPATAALAGIAVALLLGGMLMYGRKRKLAGGMFVLSILCSLFIMACNKTDKVSTNGSQNLFIRVQQVDKDGGSSYSDVIKAVKQ